MSSEPQPQSIETCLSCGVPMDLTEVAPLTIVECPHCGSPQTVLQRFGPFQLERLLGTGGMGAVYRATDVALQRPLALKVLQKNLSHDASLTAQFEREAALTARINHPNVVRVYSTGTAHGMFYIAMELVDQGSLDALMDSLGTLPEAQILRIGIQVAEGLRAAHKAGLVHRDIKPGNILFGAPTGAQIGAQTSTQGGAQPQAKIVDFGLALQTNHSQSPDAEIWGTPFYIAPEALAFKPEDLRSDMYALGATLWHALTGSPPHPLNTVSVHELLHLKKQSVSLASVHPGAHPLTAAALDKTVRFDAADRHQDYDELLSDLRGALLAVEASTPAGAHARTPARAPSRSRGLALTLGVVLAASGGVVLWQQRTQTSKPTLPEPAFQSDTERLSNAVALLRSPEKLELAVRRMRLIAANPDLSPELQVWTELSLATAHFLGGSLENASAALQEAEAKSANAAPSLRAFLRSLRAETSSPLPLEGPPAGELPEWTALRTLFTALRLTNQQRTVDAEAVLASAQPPKPEPSGASPGTGLLSLRPPLLKELQLVGQIRKELDFGANKNDRNARVRRADELMTGLQISAPLRKLAEALLKSARETPAAQPAAPTPAVPPKAAPKQETKPEAKPVPAPKADTSPAPAPPKTGAPDPEKLRKVREKVTAEVQLFQFKEALKACAAFTPAGPVEAAEKARLEGMVTACETLFRSTIQEIGRGAPLPPPLLRNGTLFKFDPVSADATQILVRTSAENALLPVRWADISPVYLVKVAQQRLASMPASPQRAELLWQAGNLLLLAGPADKAGPYLEEAARLNPTYGVLLEALRAAGSTP